MTSLVFNIRTASAGDVAVASRHCSHRVADGWSNIDLSRSHLNELLHGSGTMSQSLADWYERTGAKRPAKQATAPYFTIVLGASPEFFQRSGSTENFKSAAVDWLRKEFGDDLVFAELHLDETTPHIHALVAPTYLKAARTPGRQRKDETPEEFEARKAAAAASAGVRTVGRSSSRWSHEDSFDQLRKSATAELESLGIHYGQQRPPGSPRGQSTRAWVKKGVQKVRDLWNRGKQKWAHLDEREAQLAAREKAVEQLAATVMQEQIRTRGLHDRMTSALYDLRRALPFDSLRPATRNKVSGTLSAFETELRAVDQDLKTSVSSVRKAADRQKLFTPADTDSGLRRPR